MFNLNESLKRKRDILEEIVENKNKIKKLKIEEETINKKLWLECKHTFTRVDYNERDLLKKRCIKCNLWEHPYLYK